jgi:BirA family biotin operon repressor/biotin-[acetyl-CoA-carboxylase] ligase
MLHSPALAIELPEPDALARALAARLPAFGQVDWVAETGSTNADLLARARSAPAGKPWLLGAHLQTAGRGRAGRSWQNRPGAALMMSCAFDVRLPAAALPALSPLAGLAACEALRGLVARDTAPGSANRAVPRDPASPLAGGLAVKWPNDLQWRGGKLAGLLVESLRAPGDSDAGYTVVIGIGLNLRDADALSQALERPIADWAGIAASPGIGAADLACALAGGLLDALLKAQREGLDDFVERFRRVDALAGKAVDVIDRGRVARHGIARGIDPHGRLLIETPKGITPIVVGEISVRQHP